MPEALFHELVAEHIWNTKYRLFEGLHSNEITVRDTWARIAMALSAAEAHHRDEWCSRFESALAQFRFLPGGRIMAGAGKRQGTLFNCFAMGPLQDSIDGIFSMLAEAMVTMQAGGGVACDFSTLRPAGYPAARSGNTASGPLSFMRIWDEACATLDATGSRRGAMMATLRCDHPDIERFIDARRDAAGLRHFKLGVLVSDAFLKAVEDNGPWQLMFPLAGHPAPAGAAVCERIWSGSMTPEPCAVVRTVAARVLWKHLQEAALECGDPGIIFIDRVERSNNLCHAETISAVNPSGTVSLPAHAGCNVGAINLAQFIADPFGRHPKLNLEAIAGTVAIAVRMLDNVIDLSHYPLKAQERAAHASRRIGLGITGLADAYAMLGVRYGSDASLEIAESVMATVCHSAYRASVDLAKERGAFPAFRAEKYLESSFIQSLPAEIVDAIRHKGIRNSHLLAVAPGGSINLLANNVSSGIEPIGAMESQRLVKTAGGRKERIPVHDYAYALFRRLHGEKTPLPDWFVTAGEVAPGDQLKVHAAIQAYLDMSGFRPVILPETASLEGLPDLYMQAYRLGLHGCVLFRDGQP